MIDPKAYSCPYCERNGSEWSARAAPTGVSAFDCECGAFHYVNLHDGGLTSVSRKSRRSAQRDYSAQLASVRDEFSDET